jgi:hypothetical protein
MWRGASADVLRMCAGKPAWVSYTLRDDVSAQLRGGEELDEALGTTMQSGLPDAVLLNCCSPLAISHSLPRLAHRTQGVAAFLNLHLPNLLFIRLQYRYVTEICTSGACSQGHNGPLTRDLVRSFASVVCK